jgi:translation initiation factor 4E
MSFSSFQMTVTYLTLNKTLADIDSLVIPAESPDVKSNLRFTWALWVQTESTKQDQFDYQDSTKQVLTINTIETFWNSFAHIPQPSVFLAREMVLFKDEQISSIMLFREGVRPEWEDEVNAEGGHFQFHWKPKSVEPGQIDEFWNNLVLAVIGNTIESEGEFACLPIVQGVRFVDKLSGQGKQAGVRIEIWFSKPHDPRQLQKVRTRLEKAMACHTDGSLGTVPRCDVKYHCNRSIH